MNRTLPAKTLSVSIAADPQQVYAFVSHGGNLPKWATAFCKSAIPAGDAWKVETPTGPVTIRFAAKNALGVVDHDVTLPSGQVVHSPMRIIPNGSGSEVLFTLLRAPDMTDEQYAEDARMIQQDLGTLKRVLEGGT